MMVPLWPWISMTALPGPNEGKRADNGTARARKSAASNSRRPIAGWFLFSQLLTGGRRR